MVVYYEYMDTKEAGKKGGDQTLKRHGREHFSRIRSPKSGRKKVVKNIKPKWEKLTLPQW